MSVTIQRQRGTVGSTTPFPTLQPREIAVNIPNLQLALGDAGGTPLPLLAVRYFSTTASYAAGAYVVQAGTLYRAKGTVSPGAFVAAQWDEIAGGAAGGGGGASLTISDTAPVAPTVGAMWWESDSGILWLWYNDGNTSQWVEIGGGSGVSKEYVDAADTAIRVAAAPFDALAYNGMQINGSMDVSQEKATGVATTGSNQFICDGWKVTVAGPTGVSWRQAINNGQFIGLPSLLYGITDTASPSLAAGDVQGIYHTIEGYRINRLVWGTPNAKPITIGFWTAHHRPGVYSVSVRNQAFTRCYATTYTQNAADTSEYKTITVPGCPDGVWEVANLHGIHLTFAMACGTTFTAPAANVWSSGNFVAAPGQVNGIAATTDVFRISGVVVLPGTQAPTAAQSPLIMRPFDQELVTCQRYFQKIVVVSGSVGLGQAVSPTRALIECPFPGGEMRSIPTMSVPAGSSFDLWASNAVALNLTTFPTLNLGDVRSCMIDCTVASGLVAGNATRMVGRGVAAAVLFDARL
jgi:hypothetical protein